MKHILLFNDKLHDGKDELLQTIVRGLKVHFVNVTTYRKPINSEQKVFAFNGKLKISAIFFSDVSSYDEIVNVAFKDTIEIAHGNAIETIYMPQLVFICNFTKDKVSQAHLEYFNIISVE